MLGRLQRLEVIPVVEHCNSMFTRDIPRSLNGSFDAVTADLYQIHEFSNEWIEKENNIYQVPYLFELDGSSWVEANMFLFHMAKYSTSTQSISNKLRRSAWALLDYKIFCEGLAIELFDFSALRPINRPTYRYFKSLLECDEINGRSLNQKTKVIYDFYKYIFDRGKHDFKIERVDVTRPLRVFISTNTGYIEKEIIKRSQTVLTKPATQVEVGFIRDEGEDLRPLVGDEFNNLLSAIEGEGLKVDQRLMVLIALLTGERKQTILTLRRHHLRQFNESNLGKDGMYRLNVCSTNGADTKFGKPHLLYVPKFLAEMMIRYSQCEAYLSRVAKFERLHGNILKNDDMYLFLSREGNCHYMAKSDPRYLKVRTRPSGGNTKTITDSLIAANVALPKNFSFHWLRATFAHQFYESLRPLVSSGALKHGDDISLIQKRLHHSHRETTESYLKLFSTVNERLQAQELYENTLFGSNKSEIIKIMTGVRGE
ncbi:site-specific integrase [Pseudoalteromonas sp. T1lg75]|uniref:site-specific integrase n=1 Tax=Pseudoalteromonas sp. T1lg75 TaxID=2077102 RepID=UPI000CF6CB45|nr:site-specific integrase [Pseudoalteromonas sp. T1lg75]